MKHLTLAAACLALLAAPAWGQWSDDFESYALDSSLFGQGGWEGWNGSASGTPSDLVVADPDPLVPPGNQVVAINPGNDIARPHTEFVGGAWVLTGRVFIPLSQKDSGNNAWVWMMSNYNVGGTISYSLGLHFNFKHNVAWHDEAAQAPVPLTFDAWKSFRIEIDLEANLVTTYYDNAKVGLATWYNPTNVPGEQKAIGATELYVDAGAPVYFDDLAIAAGTPTVPPVDVATDLTTNGLLRSKYLVNVGGELDDMQEYPSWRPTGLFTLANSYGNQQPWYAINNGNPRDVSVTFGGYSPDYFGYRFKMPATVDHVVWWNYVFYDGGTFAAQPELQYLDAIGGTWQTISDVTWDTPYDNICNYGTSCVYDFNLSYGFRRYVITINNPPPNIWGLRLYGDPQPGQVDFGTGTCGDPGTGFLGVAEMTLYGTINLGALDLTNNLALASKGGVGIARFCRQGAAGIALLNDGLVDAAGDSAGNVSPTDEDWVGVTWPTAQNNVAAVGMFFQGFKDGGFFGNDWEGGGASVRIEYTTDGGTTWMPVSGLDVGSYAADANRLQMSCKAPDPYNGQKTAYLFRFDPISGINGIRIIGNPSGFSLNGANATAANIGDCDGFLGWREFEVYANSTGESPAAK